MPQTLLRSNRRIAMLGFGITAVFAVVAAIVGAWVAPAARTILSAAMCFTLLAGLAAWRLACRPRLQLTDSELLVLVTLLRRPVRVPLDAVEVFFIGQGAVSGEEPGQPREYQGAVAANVIVRLAEAESTWHAHLVNQWLAVWADGYITLRGLWCENIDQELLATMNRQLMAAKRKQRQEVKQ